MSSGGWVRPARSSIFAGVEKRPISGIWGTFLNFRTSRASATSWSGVPAVLTTPNAAISGLSVVGRSFVTTSPFSTAASWASSSWITLRRNGRGGASCCAGATAGARTARKQAHNTPDETRFRESTLVIESS